MVMGIVPYISMVVAIKLLLAMLQLLHLPPPLSPLLCPGITTQDGTLTVK